MVMLIESVKFVAPYHEDGSPVSHADMNWKLDGLVKEVLESILQSRWVRLETSAKGARLSWADGDGIGSAKVEQVEGHFRFGKWYTTLKHSAKVRTWIVSGSNGRGGYQDDAGRDLHDEFEANEVLLMAVIGDPVRVSIGVDI